MTQLDENTTPKRPRGRPRNDEPSIQWSFTIPESMARDLNKLQGVYGPTRSAVMQAILRQWYEALGPEGIAALKKAHRYGKVIDKRRLEEQAKVAWKRANRAHVVSRSAGWLDGDGNELSPNS